MFHNLDVFEAGVLKEPGWRADRRVAAPYSVRIAIIAPAAGCLRNALGQL